MFFLLVQVFPYPNYTTNLAMNMVSLFMPLLVMLGLMYSAMTIIKVIQLWNRFLVIIVLCWNIFNSLSSQNNNVCLGKVYFLVWNKTKLQRLMKNFRASLPFKPQYPHTNSPNWSLYILLKNKLREFDERSKHFLLGDQFINSHNQISWQSMDMVTRKLMLDTIGTSRVNITGS